MRPDSSRHRAPAAAPNNGSAQNHAGSARTAKERLLQTLAVDRRQCQHADLDTPLLRRLLSQEPDKGVAV